MTVWGWVGVVLVAVALGGVGQVGRVTAQEDSQLARLMLDDTVRRGIDEQVGARMM